MSGVLAAHLLPLGGVWGPGSPLAPTQGFMGSWQPTRSHLGVFWVLAAHPLPLRGLWGPGSPPSPTWGSFGSWQPTRSHRAAFGVPAAAQGGFATCHWARCRSGSPPHPRGSALLRAQPCIPFAAPLSSRSDPAEQRNAFPLRPPPPPLFASPSAEQRCAMRPRQRRLRKDEKKTPRSLKSTFTQQLRRPLPPPSFPPPPPPALSQPKYLWDERTERPYGRAESAAVWFESSRATGPDGRIAKMHLNCLEILCLNASQTN